MAKAKRATRLHRWTLSEIEEASSNNAGFCLACGFEQDGVEPDAEGYKCEDCGQPKVYGAEEVFLMGHVR